MKLLFALTILLMNCNSNNTANTTTEQENISAVEEERKEIIVGAAQFDKYIPALQGKKVGLVINHTAMVNGVHLLDTLLAQGVNVVKIYAPEHGFRGTADAGEHIKSDIDAKTGIPVISLYGANRRPSKQDMQGVDVIIFDIQDVGARFYTYISTMSYVMEAAAEHGVEFLVLDRPNPTGHYVDGPVLEKEFSSFIGLHEIPVVHGMTVGEYARMVNGEYWLKDSLQVKLTVVPVQHYDHNTHYDLPVKPSPNLPNMRAIYLYPSLAPFEATPFNLGRGTNKQFQVLGAPKYPAGDYTYTPVPMEGAKEPKHKGKEVRGYDLTTIPVDSLRNMRQLDLSYLITTYENYPEKEKFFESHFAKLAGTKALQKQIQEGMSEAEIRKSWEPKLSEFMQVRKKYLLYPDLQ